MSILMKNVLRKMRLFCAILLIFCSRQTGVESERYLKQPTLLEALPLSSSRIYLAWKGPINHPGGIRYRIYLKKESETFKQHKDISGASSKAILDGLESNVRYEVCVTVVDNHYKTASSSCDDVSVITTPAQLGHVSKTDRKYLSKAGFYRGCRHYWPLDNETQIRDVRYSRDGKKKGSEVSVAGKGRGYLSISGNSWVRLGKFSRNCVCNARYCAKNGVSIAFWVKLSNYDNETKILFGSNTRVPTNTSGLVIFQTFQNENGTQARHISALVFMKHRKWKCSFPVQPGIWFYLTVTWSNRSGLRIFRNSILMDEQKRPQRKARVFRRRDGKCSMTLSPPTAHKTTLNADYDDVVIWYYELNQTLMHQVYRNSIGLPKIVDCTTNGTSLDISIEDKYQIYDIKRDFKITWWRSGGDQKETSFTTDLRFTIHGLVQRAEYIVEIQRRMFLSESSKSKVVLSKSLKSTCNTKPHVPTKPKKFRIRETAAKYFMLEWQPPDNIHDSLVLAYKISYRIDDFKYPPKWTDTFRANVNRAHLDPLEPFTDYIIKLSCRNQYGYSKAITIRATTAEGVPTVPRRFRVKLKGEAIVAKWREPEKPNGVVHYRLFALVNGTKKTICRACGELYKLEDIEQYTNYTFWVIAYNINNDPRYKSGPSEYVHITTPSYTPTSPRNLTASFTQGGINVRWEMPKEPMGTIEYKLLGLVNTSKQVFCDECGLHYIMEDVAKYTVYTFWVLAYNVHQGYESGTSEKIKVDTASCVPTIPNELRVNTVSAGILVSWNKSRVQHGSIRYQLTGYENGLKREFCSDCGLNYRINKSEPNMNYSFWVVAHNIRNGYESLASSIVHFYTARSKPPPPEHIVVSEVKDSSAKLTWTPPGGLSEQDIFGYKVTLYDAYHVIYVMQTQSRHHEFKNLTQFSKYYVTVQVLSRAGYGPPSSLLTIHTKDTNECLMSDVPCSKYAQCINSAGSYFCSCIPGYVGDGIACEELPSGVRETNFCLEETARNITWKKTYYGHKDKRLCPNGTIGISTRECLKGNDSRSYWCNPDLSGCVSAWMSEVDDKLADGKINATGVGDFFIKLLDKNDLRGLYGGDIIKSVNLIDLLFNKSKDNELSEETSNPEAAETLLKNLIKIIEKIISPEKLKVWEDLPEKRRTEHSVRIIDGLDNAVLKSAKIVDFSSIPNEHINVQYGRVSNFKLRNNMSDTNLDDGSIKLPQPERETDFEDQAVAVIKYNTIAEVLSAGNQEFDEEDIVNSAVLSVSLNPPLSEPFKEPLEFKLSNQKDDNFVKHKCAFFNASRYHGFWSTKGCEVFNVTENFTVCHCYHMTSFSVLMQVRPVELSYSDKLILDWVTRIGLCISLVALGLAFVTFVFLPRPCGSKAGSRCFRLCEQGYRPNYLKKIRTNIHANLILSLTLGEALFLWGIEKTYDKTTCYTVAVALHYFFLVAFHWMAAEGVILYLVLVKVFQRKSAKKDKRMFMIICWGSPAAIVCTALVVGHQYYLHEKFCWLSVTHGMIWGFVGPALAIIMVNFFFLCCTFCVMARRQSWAKADKNIVTKIRYWAKGAAIVTCLLGVTWVFGVFFLNSDSVVVAYIFTICNVFQGLFIFVFHCLLDEKIRQQYYQVLCAVHLISTESQSPGNSTSTPGKKEQRRSTFHSWFWSAIPTKFQDSKSFQDNKSESCPTVAENTLKRMNSSTHSLSQCIDRRLLEIKRNSDSMTPRGMSSIYHDSDENMDNIPDNILTVKHGSKSNSERLDYQDEETTGGVFEDSWISTVSRKNSKEFQEVPEATCEDCLYEMKDWEELEILRKTSSLHEGELKTLKEPCSFRQSEKEYLTEETNMNDKLCEDNIRDKEDQHKLLSSESDKNIEQTDQSTSYTSVVPQIFLSVPGSTSV